MVNASIGKGNALLSQGNVEAALQAYNNASGNPKAVEGEIRALKSQGIKSRLQAALRML